METRKITILVILVLAIALILVYSPYNPPEGTGPTTATSTATSTQETSATATKSTTPTSAANKAVQQTTPTSPSLPSVTGTHFINYIYNNSNLSFDPQTQAASMTQLRVTEPIANAQITTFVVDPRTIWVKNGKTVSLSDIGQNNTTLSDMSFDITAIQIGSEWYAKEVSLTTITFTLQRSAYFVVTGSAQSGEIEAPSFTTNLFTLSNGISQNNRVLSAPYQLLASGKPLEFSSQTQFSINGTPSTYAAIAQKLSTTNTRATLKASGYIDNNTLILSHANFLFN